MPTFIFIKSNYIQRESSTYKSVMCNQYSFKFLRNICNHMDRSNRPLEVNRFFKLVDFLLWAFKTISNNNCWFIFRYLFKIFNLNGVIIWNDFVAWLSDLLPYQLYLPNWVYNLYRSIEHFIRKKCFNYFESVENVFYFSS